MLPTANFIRYERRGAMFRAGFALLIAIVIAAPSYLLHPLASLSVLTVGVIVGAGLYWFSTSTSRRRKKIITKEFSPAWRDVLLCRVDYYRDLDELDRERFERNVQIFLAEKAIEGTGVELDETLRVLVAASAIIPIFGFEDWEYGMLDLVVVRPEPFEAHFRKDISANDSLFATGMVGDIGIFSGTLVLSAPDLLRDFQLEHDKHNVGVHEFSHLIDKASGHIDGFPVSLPYKSFNAWGKMVHNILAQGRRGANCDIPQYGFTNESEFFAVISEYFFEKPKDLAQHHPELFGLLEEIFRQHPLKKNKTAV